MNQPGQVARLVEAVSGLEQAVTGIAAILEGHGEMLARLLAAAEEKPPEQAEMHELIRALTSLLRQQQEALQRIEKGIGTVGQALAKAAGEQ